MPKALPWRLQLPTSRRIGTLVAQLVLKDQISKFLSSEYVIQGTYDAPEVKKLSRAQSQKDAASQKN